MLGFVFENIVEGHEPCADLRVALSAAVLRVGIAEQPVDRLGEEMIDLPSLPVVEDFDVAGDAAFSRKSITIEPLLPVDEVIELAAKEVAGVGGDKVKERGLAFRVAERFKSGDRIDRS